MSTKGDVIIDSAVDKLLKSVKAQGIIAGFEMCKVAVSILLDDKSAKVLTQIEIDVLMDEMIDMQNKLLN